MVRQGVVEMFRSVLSTLTVLLLAVATTAGAQNASTPGAEGGPKVDQAWARATPGASRTGAAYFRIESPVDDRLTAVATPVARKAEVHTHVEENGVMRMREVEGGLALPAGKPIELKPTALHVMLMDLIKPLKAGEHFPLTLSFAHAMPRTVEVQVEPVGAMGPTRRSTPKPSGS